MDQHSLMIELVTRNVGQSNQWPRGRLDMPAANPLLTRHLKHFAASREQTEVEGIRIRRQRSSVATLRQTLARQLRALAIVLDPTLPSLSAASAFRSGPSSARVGPHEEAKVGGANR